MSEILDYPFNWRIKVDKKLYNEAYNATVNDRTIVCKTNTDQVDITLFTSDIFDQLDEFNRYAIYNGLGSNDVCVDILGGGTFFQGPVSVCIPPASMILLSVINIYDDETESFINSWAILSDTLLVSTIGPQSEIVITGQDIFVVELAQPVRNDANVTVDEVLDTLTINDTGEYTVKSSIRLVDDLPSGDTINVLINIYNSLDVSIRQEMKQYSLSGDETESIFEFHNHFNTGDYIQWEIETLTNFTGKYQLLNIEIDREIKGFG